MLCSPFMLSSFSFFLFYDYLNLLCDCFFIRLLFFSFLQKKKTFIFLIIFLRFFPFSCRKQIESLNTPSPRCSHQAVFFKDKLYVFGGEYATLDQFHHYRSLFFFDSSFILHHLFLSLLILIIGSIPPLQVSQWE